MERQNDVERESLDDAAHQKWARGSLNDPSSPGNTWLLIGGNGRPFECLYSDAFFIHYIDFSATLTLIRTSMAPRNFNLQLRAHDFHPVQVSHIKLTLANYQHGESTGSSTVARTWTLTAVQPSAPADVKCAVAASGSGECTYPNCACEGKK